MTRSLIRLRPLSLGLIALLIASLAPVTASAQSSSDQEILPEWEDAGVIDVGEYESPAHGYSVEWTDAWLIWPDAPELAVQSSGQGFDSLWLYEKITSTLLGITSDNFEEYGYEDPETAGDEFIEPWETGDITEIITEYDDVEVLLSDTDDDYGAMLAGVETAGGDELIVYREMNVINRGDAVVIIMIQAAPVDFLALYELANESIEVDGDPLFETLDIDEVEEVLTDETGTGDDEDEDDEDDTGNGTSGNDYLDEVAEHYSDLDASFDRFFELLTAEDLTEEENEELNTLYELWLDAEDDAEALDPDPDYDEIGEAYLDYTSAVTEAGEAFETFLDTDADTPEFDEAIDDFLDAVDTADSIGLDLVDLLEDEGIDISTTGDDRQRDNDDEDDSEDIGSDFI